MEAKQTQTRRLYNAEIRATGKRVQIYRHRTGTFIDYEGCRTEYFDRDIIILNEIKS